MPDRGFCCKFGFRRDRRYKTQNTMTKLKNVLHSYAIGMGIKGIWKHARISGTPHTIWLI